MSYLYDDDLRLDDDEWEEGGDTQTGQDDGEGEIGGMNPGDDDEEE